MLRNIFLAAIVLASSGLVRADSIHGQTQLARSGFGYHGNTRYPFFDSQMRARYSDFSYDDSLRDIYSIQYSPYYRYSTPYYTYWADWMNRPSDTGKYGGEKYDNGGKGSGKR